MITGIFVGSASSEAAVDNRVRVDVATHNNKFTSGGPVEATEITILCRFYHEGSQALFSLV